MGNAEVGQALSCDTCFHTQKRVSSGRFFKMGRKAEVQRIQLEKLMGPEGEHSMAFVDVLISG